MTEAMINLPEAISKSDDTDFLRELIQDAAQRLMEIEVGAVCGAGLRERTPDRGNQRNGLSYAFPRLLCDKDRCPAPQICRAAAGDGSRTGRPQGPCGSVIAPVFFHDLNG